MLTYILIVTAIVLVAALLYLRRTPGPDQDVVEQARERAAQRQLDRRASANTSQDAYNRTYDLNTAMSVVEVDESANGYGMLDDEQKRVIAAVFDNQLQTETSIKTGGPRGAKYSYSVFGDLNQVEPVADRDIWSITRN